MQAVQQERPVRMPGGGVLGLGAARRLIADPLGLFDALRGYGDVVQFPVGPMTAYFVNDPELVHQIVVDDVDMFQRTRRIKRVLGQMIGRGMLLTDGPFWRKQRRLVTPAFHHQRLRTYADDMTTMADRLMSTWRDDDVREIDADMQRVTLNIVAKTLFNADDEAFATRVHQVATALQKEVGARIRAPFTMDWLPTPRNKRYFADLRTLDDIAVTIIRERRASGVDHGDVLSMLMAAHDEDGSMMSDQQVRDEAITLLLAGHDTTALALTWTMYLLAQHPQVEEKLTAELDALLDGGRLPTLADLPRLSYTEKVFKEVLRLFPPAPLLTRETVAAVRLGNVMLPAGATVYFSPYWLHRDARFYEAPEVFNPDRFVDGFEKTLPRCAYMPFLSGPHVCIGMQFATMEAKLLLAAFARRWRFEIEPGQVVEPRAFITLYPSGPCACV